MPEQRRPHNFPAFVTNEVLNGLEKEVIDNATAEAQNPSPLLLSGN
jgi:hypothetical protein